MRTIRHIFIGLVLAAITYCIVKSVAEWYVDQLKATGGMVTASDVISARFTPISISILIFAGYLKLTLE